MRLKTPLVPICVLLAGSVDAAVRPVGLTELTDRADRIVIGKIGESSTVVETFVVATNNETGEDYTYTGVFTCYLVAVSEHLKGNSSDDVILRMTGGPHPDGVHYTVAFGDPAFSKGEEVMLFLEEAWPSRHFDWPIHVLSGDRYAKLDISKEGQQRVVRPAVRNEILEQDFGAPSISLTFLRQLIQTTVDSQQ